MPWVCRRSRAIWVADAARGATATLYERLSMGLVATSFAEHMAPGLCWAAVEINRKNTPHLIIHPLNEDYCYKGPIWYNHVPPPTHPNDLYIIPIYNIYYYPDLLKGVFIPVVKVDFFFLQLFINIKNMLLLQSFKPPIGGQVPRVRNTALKEEEV